METDSTDLITVLLILIFLALLLKHTIRSTSVDNINARPQHSNNLVTISSSSRLQAECEDCVTTTYIRMLAVALRSPGASLSLDCPSCLQCIMPWRQVVEQLTWVMPGAWTLCKALHFCTAYTDTHVAVRTSAIVSQLRFVNLIWLTCCIINCVLLLLLSAIVHFAWNLPSYGCPLCMAFRIDFSILAWLLTRSRPVICRIGLHKEIIMDILAVGWCVMVYIYTYIHMVLYWQWTIE